MLSLLLGSDIKTEHGGRLVCRSSRQLGRDGDTGRQQGLNILAREDTNIAVPKAPISQADWLWDCTTPDAALAGTSVSAGALRFCRKNTGSETFFTQIASVDRRSKRGSWPSGPGVRFPERLNPCAVRNAAGTPEGGPLQVRTSSLSCVTARIPSPFASRFAPATATLAGND